ncbi:MAG TPA: PD-(D/E)XK nuclease family protein [Verrucomicrobiae bacterium]|jgi:hypothetical protein|nr:PD-(D/E)XK nuclease family protein [Verrucomicrobiae bacterium]
MTSLENPLPGQGELKKFFSEVGSLLPLEENGSIPNLSEFEKFFDEFHRRNTRAEQKRQAYDARNASHFNYFHLLDPDENKLSEVLAFLLDPNERHGQGPAFLKLLFTKLQVSIPAVNLGAATVRCEAHTYLIDNYCRRVDVLIDAGKIVAIENKLSSSEQNNQVTDYLEHLARLAGRKGDAILIYLSPDGRLPDSTEPDKVRDLLSLGRLRCWSYQKELASWLEQCRQICQASRIRDLISDFLAYIKTTLLPRPESQQEEEIYEH